MSSSYKLDVTPNWTIALVCMTKNGMAKLPRLFKSVEGFVDKHIIMDTGSTDGTWEWLKEQELLVPPKRCSFVDFGSTRTELMKYAKDKADWLLLLDDDMAVRFDRPIAEIKADMSVTQSCYTVKHDQTVTYWVTRLVRGNLDWVYKGVTHEYLDGTQWSQKLPGILIDHFSNHGPPKFERDLRLLSADIARDPYDARTIFYLAQTLRDMRHTIPAIHYYTMRANMGGWPEEVFYSMYEAARLAQDPKGMMAAHAYRPSRAEAAAWLVRYYAQQEAMEQAVKWEEIRVKISITSDILFVHSECYGEQRKLKVL